ncbi:hypothetical protein CBER1_09029 [Cercospora berteroae]|uniref:Uncharacterized protein n=1 Tax=Cercospora berteroae TaxID=357750 RepID=A0A2S6CC47_9PEZI|nr:hypothetical protein CBER1_09029 [Cercospora berteroae]
MAKAVDTLLPQDYTGDAAARVFAVPELLEEILLLTVDDQYPLGPFRDWDLKLWPMPACGYLWKGGICLYRIQRVSTAFRHTIQGSNKLKQLMFLAPQDNAALSMDYDSLLLLHKPVLSLMSIMRLSDADYTVEFDEIEVVRGIASPAWKTFEDLFSPHITPFNPTIGRLRKGWRNPEASWRKIKVCNAKVPAPLNVRLFYGPYHANDEIPPFSITFALDKDDTLEHLFNHFDGFMATLSQYYAKKHSTNLDHEEEQRLLEQKQAKERDELAQDFGEALKHGKGDVEDAKTLRL